jgi:hypothetical protein
LFLSVEYRQTFIAEDKQFKKVHVVEAWTIHACLRLVTWR